MRCLNAVLGGRESHGPIGTRLPALLYTLAAIAGVPVLLALVAAFPVVLEHLGRGRVARAAVSVARWAALVLFIGVGPALL